MSEDRAPYIAPYIERRRDYPDVLAEIVKLRSEQEQQRTLLQAHIRETQELTELWMGSRWFLNTLKFLAITASTFAAGYLALRHLGKD